MNHCCLVVCLCCCWTTIGEAQSLWPGYVDSGVNGEQVREIRFAEDARALVVAPSPADLDIKKPTLLVVYATPNGNTAEQTLGCLLKEEIDWHFDIQHVAAQWRAFRELETERNVVLACLQANNLSWPAWKGQRQHGLIYIRQIVEGIASSLPAEDVGIVLAGHSGGGSFIFGYIDAAETIPPLVERIAFLDANYGYDTALKHGEKVLSWLDGDASHHFIVVAYDDRNIELDGKKVVSPTGGTYRATNRLLEFLKQQTAVEELKQGDFMHYSAVDGRLVALVHPNPENIILHTRLVGEMNGLVGVLALGTPYHEQHQLATPRAYTDHVQSEPFNSADWHPTAPALPPRPSNLRGGSDVVNDLRQVSAELRENHFEKEILRGNVPTFWRQFVEVAADLQLQDGEIHKVVYRVAPDYLMVGSDEDFVRVPLTPYVAQHIADVLGCLLPTRKMVDDIYRAADAKLAPYPLTENRESLATFQEHNRLIQQAWTNREPSHLIAGIKKDVVMSDQLLKRPGRVAIYGWHKLDGEPIQPLTTMHVDRYVDYSHGIRLLDQWCEVDGVDMRVEDVLQNKDLCALLSDEGPLECLRYRRSSHQQ